MHEHSALLACGALSRIRLKNHLPETCDEAFLILFKHSQAKGL